MNKNKYLQEIEKKAFQAHITDGFIEVILAFLLFGNAMGILLDSTGPLGRTAGFLGTYLIGVLIFFFGKKFISVPRVGKFKVGEIRLKKILKMHIVIGVAVVSTLLLWILPWLIDTKLGSFGQSFPVIPVFFFVFIFAIFGSIAWFLDYNRLFITAFIMAACWFFNELFTFYDYSGAGKAVVFGVGGLLILILGISMFKRFIDSHPPIYPEAA